MLTNQRKIQMTNKTAKTHVFKCFTCLSWADFLKLFVYKVGRVTRDFTICDFVIFQDISFLQTTLRNWKHLSRPTRTSGLPERPWHCEKACKPHWQPFIMYLCMGQWYCTWPIRSYKLNLSVKYALHANFNFISASRTLFPLSLCPTPLPWKCI